MNGVNGGALAITVRITLHPICSYGLISSKAVTVKKSKPKRNSKWRNDGNVLIRHERANDQPCQRAAAPCYEH